MIYYDTIFLRKNTLANLFILEYAKAFHEFHRDLDQKFIDPLANFNVKAPHYWGNWRKTQELTDFCKKHRLHPETFWDKAYEVIRETGESTKSYNTFALDWVKDGVLQKNYANDGIEPAKFYTQENYTKGNPYYLIYYKALLKRLHEKYGPEYKNVLSKMIENKVIHLNIVKDFKEELCGYLKDL